MLTAAAVTGVFLILIELLRSLPALFRVIKYNTSDGISGSAMGISAGAGLGWILIALLIESWWLTSATVLWLVIHIITCIYVGLINPEKCKPMIHYAVITASGLAMVVICFNPWLGIVGGLGVALPITSAMSAAPALLEGMRSPTTSGLSVTAMAVNTIEALAYIAMGIGIIAISENHNSIAGYTAFGVISFISHAPRLARVCWRRVKGLDAGFKFPEPSAQVAIA